MSSFPFGFWRLDPTFSGLGGFGLNYGYEFDGVDENISISNPIAMSSDYSFSFWFKTSNTVANNYILGASIYSVIMNWTELQVSSSDNSFDIIGVPVRGFADGKWHMAAYTYNRTTGDFKCYIDGVLKAANSATTGVNLPQFTKIGSSIYNTWYYEGRLDDIQFYNFELNSTQVSDIYNSGYVTAPTASPIHHWKMGESDTWDGSNWGVLDSVGSLVGTSVNMEEADRKLGVAYSMNFDGIDEYIDFGNVLDLDGFNPFTISLWGKFSSSDTILNKEDGSNIGYRLTIDGNSKINFSIGDGSSNRIRIRQSVGGGWTTEINHLVLTYDGSGLASGFTLYKNGSSESFGIFIDSLSNSSNTGSFYIAKSSAFAGLEGNNFFNGNLMSLSKYDTELTATDVSNLYNSGVPVDPRDVSLNPSFFAPLGGPNDTFSTDWTFIDEVGGNNGTSVNMEESDKTSDTP